jgi:hypothetical protein
VSASARAGDRDAVLAALGDPASVHAAAAPARRAVRRAIVVGAPVLYVGALAVFVASWGLPVARDQLFLWLLLGLAAFSVGAWHTWGALLAGWLPLLGLLVVYDELRGAVAVVPGRAHWAAQTAVDQWIGGGAVPTDWLQRRLWTPGDLHWFDYAVWGVYMTHFFAVWLVAAMLWRVARDRFPHYALLTAALTLAAFLVYWRYPAQPPWLAAESGHIAPVERIVPIVWDRLGVGSMKSVYENRDVVNTVAAMPSLHAAYPLMLLLFFWRSGRCVRAGLALYTIAMAYALVYGGEHFVTDIVAGWAMTGVVFAGVATVRRRARERGPARVARCRQERVGPNGARLSER